VLSVHNKRRQKLQDMRFPSLGATLPTSCVRPSHPSHTHHHQAPSSSPQARASQAAHREDTLPTRQACDDPFPPLEHQTTSLLRSQKYRWTRRCCACCSLRLSSCHGAQLVLRRRELPLPSARPRCVSSRSGRLRRPCESSRRAVWEIGLRRWDMADVGDSQVMERGGSRCGPWLEEGGSASGLFAWDIPQWTAQHQDQEKQWSDGESRCISSPSPRASKRP